MRATRISLSMALLGIFLTFTMGCNATKASWNWTVDGTVAMWDGTVNLFISDIDASGPVYEVNLDARAFRCIGETGRMEVRWSQETKMIFSDVRADLAEVPAEGRDARLYLGENWREELNLGTFRVKKGEIFETRGALAPSLPKEDAPALTGILKGSLLESPTMEVGGLVFKIRAGGKGAEYQFITPMQEAELKPFETWVRRVEGKIKGGKENRLILAEKMVFSRQEDPAKGDDPNLKRVLIIGDSVSFVTWPTVESALKGKVNLHRPLEAGARVNCGSSANGLQNIRRWLGPYWLPGRQWDVIQFNFGLHDIEQRYNVEKKSWTGDFNESPSQYRKNLEEIIGELEKTGAGLIWASTTPVPADSLRNDMGRQVSTANRFNIEAKDVLNERLNILTNDLWQACQGHYGAGASDPWLDGSNVYFNSAGRKAVGTLVARFILKSVGIME